MAQEKFSQQNRKSHGERKILTTKEKSSQQNKKNKNSGWEKVKNNND